MNAKLAPTPSLVGLLRPYKGLLIGLLSLALASNALNLVIPRLIGWAMDRFSQGQFAFTGIISDFVLAAMGVFVFAALQSVVQTYASERVARDLRSTLAAKISRQSYQAMQQANPAKLLTHLTSDIDSVKMFIAQAVVSVVSSVFLIIGASALLLLLNWRLASVVLLIIPVIGGVFFVVFGKVRVLFLKTREVIDWLNKVINESILAAALVRVLDSQRQEYQKFLAANANAKRLGLQILALFASMIPVIIFVSNLATLAIVVLGGHLVIQGGMSLGDIAAFNSYVALLIFPIMMLGFMSNIIAQAAASYQRVSTVLEATEIHAGGTTVEPLTGNVAVRGVCVSFGDKMILRQVSFDVAAGTRTALIGPTAAGKTQLLYVLTGLVAPSSGTVEYDGRRMEDYQRECLHRQIGFVFQDSVMFQLSVRENIAFSRAVSDADLQRAIDTAELTEFIDALPQKLDTPVSERGANLSGGQKQRIMLARALALHPKILLLDDFTARVDPQTERRILSKLQRNYPDITLIAVSQKVSSVEDYDQIVVLMEGEVLATGRHQELLERCPEYVQIYDSQRSARSYELHVA